MNFLGFSAASGRHGAMYAEFTRFPDVLLSRDVAWAIVLFRVAERMMAFNSAFGLTCGSPVVRTNYLKRVLYGPLMLRVGSRNREYGVPEYRARIVCIHGQRKIRVVCWG